MLIGSQVYPVELLDFLVLVPHPHTGVPSTSKMNFLPLNPCPEVYFWGTLFVTTKVSLLSLACHHFNSLHSTYYQLVFFLLDKNDYFSPTVI